MEAHNDVIVCGTLIEEINSSGENLTQNQKSQKLPKKLINVESASIKATLFFGCPLAHPTICIRTSVIKANLIRYNESIRVAEDYVLYAEILQKGNFIIINKPLLKYRVYQNDSKITTPNNRDKFYQARKVAWKIILDYLNIEYPQEVIFSIHDKFTYYPHFLTEQEFLYIDIYFQFLIDLNNINKRTLLFNDEYFNFQIVQRIYHGLSNRLIPIAIRQELFKKHKDLLPVKSLIKLRLKSLKEKIEQ